MTEVALTRVLLRLAEFCASQGNTIPEDLATEIASARVDLILHERKRRDNTVAVRLLGSL